MTFLRGIQATDSPSIDAFGRWRVSNPETIFDSKQIFDSAPLYWDDAEVSGSGTSTAHSTNEAATTITVGATTAGKRVRQTYRRFNYQPGKSQLILCTWGEFDTSTGITKEVGYFDDNNGLFFRSDEGTLSVVRRTYVTGAAVDNPVSQSSWNIDSLDGTGASGITLDLTKTQIGIIDFEWLGVGRVRMGFVIDGVIYYCHQFLNANNLGLVYMSTPNLPLRYSIENDGNGATDDFLHVCSSIISEGGSEQLGATLSVSRGATSFTTASNTSVNPLIGIRLKSTHLGATIIPESFSVLCTSTADFEILVLLNPTVAGSDAASWTSLANSAVEYDVTRDNTNLLSSYVPLYSEVASSTNQFRAQISPELKQSILIGADISGNQDELILAVRNLSAAAETYYATFNFRELS